jgi:hypothetical protein
LTSGVAHSCLSSCWLLAWMSSASGAPTILFSHTKGDIRFKNVGLLRTGIHEKPSNRAPISRFSSHLIGNL